MLPAIHPMSISINHDGSVNIAYDKIMEQLMRDGVLVAVKDPPNGGCVNTANCTGQNTACGNGGCG